MLIKESQAKKVANSDACAVQEYEFESEDLSLATAIINGRYPDEGRVFNRGCEEIYYVLSGSGVVHSEFGDFQICKGDAYHFKKGEKYWTEGDELRLVLVNAPKWTPEQHEKE